MLIKLNIMFIKFHIQFVNLIFCCISLTLPCPRHAGYLAGRFSPLPEDMPLSLSLSLLGHHQRELK